MSLRPALPEILAKARKSEAYRREMETFNKSEARHFTRAAKLAAEHGQGLCYLLDRGLYVRYRKAFGFYGTRLTGSERATALCFMAAMVETGDA